MTDDTLERLLIDRSLGALPADVEALLAAYIESRPVALQAARGLDSVVATARHVLSARDSFALPAPPVVSSAQTWRITSLAACLLIGVGLGAVAARWGGQGVPERQSMPALVHQPDPVEATARDTVSVVRPPEDADAFWSANKMLSGARTVSSRSSSPLRWTSPVSSPLPKGKS